jgi:UDP-3-O-[3-hydroxymyristoyl] glucosamine N-acyltransferase
VKTTLEELAELVGGQLCGDGRFQITGAKPVGSAGPNDITFARDKHYLDAVEASGAGAALVPPEVSSERVHLIRVADPLKAFVKIVQHFHTDQDLPEPGIHPTSVINPSAQIGADVHIGPHVVIGRNTVIGDRCCVMAGAVIEADCLLGEQVVLYPRVVLHRRTRLGDRVVVHPGAVIGSEGFGFQHKGGRIEKVPQMGWVEVGNDVEIGANTTIDRGTFEATRIGDGTKIDNQVQIAHNCKIGRRNILVAQVGIAGSVTTGDDVVIAGQAGIRDHIRIGDGAVVGAMAGIMRDVEPGTQVVGLPATPLGQQRRLQAVLLKLPEFYKEVREFMKRAEEQLDRVDPEHDRSCPPEAA